MGSIVIFLNSSRISIVGSGNAIYTYFYTFNYIFLFLRPYPLSLSILSSVRSIEKLITYSGIIGERKMKGCGRKSRKLEVSSIKPQRRLIQLRCLITNRRVLDFTINLNYMTYFIYTIKPLHGLIYTRYH